MLTRTIIRDKVSRAILKEFENDEDDEKVRQGVEVARAMNQTYDERLSVFLPFVRHPRMNIYERYSTDGDLLAVGICALAD
jgi:hypothetical protein